MKARAQFLLVVLFVGGTLLAGWMLFRSGSGDRAYRGPAAKAAEPAPDAERPATGTAAPPAAREPKEAAAAPYSGPGLYGVVLDPAGEPVADALVVASSVLSHGDGRTGPDGRFGFPLEAEGVYAVTAKAGEYAPGVLEGVKFVPGAKVEDLVLRLEVGAVVTGRVLSTAGDPVAGAVVHALDAEAVNDAMLGAMVLRQAPQDRTGEDGRFRIAGLPPGNYKLLAKAEGGAEGRSAPFPLAPGQTRNLDVRFAGGPVVTGRVVDRRGKPVAGARVEPAPQGIAMFVPGMATGPAATTQDDGTFALPGVTEVGDLRATKEGYAPAFARAVAPGQAEVGFVLGDLGSISGIVRDEKGGPVEAFEVEARSAGGGFAGMGALFPAGRAEVLGGGKFRIAGVVAGEYDVRVYAGDLAPGVVPGVAVKEGEETGGLVIRLTAGATLRGIVTAGEGGPPVSGAQVSADITGNPVLARARQGRERSATTGEDGRFVLSGLPEGSTTVKVVHPDYAPRTLDNVRLPATDELVIQLSAGGTVVVRVLLEDGSPDPGKMVILQRNVPYEQKIAMADPRGEARFEKVPPGGWMVMRMDAQAMQKKGFSAADMEMRIAEVSDGEETVVEIRPSRGASIRGRVTRGGRPVSGAMVFLTGQGEAQEAISGMKFGTTAEDGTYSLDRVPPGEHTIAVSRPNNFVPVFSEKVVVGDRDVTKNLAMPPGGAAGTVTDERGSPLGGVQVLAVPSDRADFRSGSMNDAMHAFGGMTTSASDGSFRFEGLAPGGYVLRVWREGMAPAYSDPFSMPELGDGPHDLSVRVPAGTDQKVEVRGPDGSPLEGAWVYVTDPAGRLLSIGMNQGVRTDPAGVAVLRLAPGPYRVEVQPPRLPAVSRSVTVPGGTIRIDVPTGGTISATVRDAAGKAVAGARVRLRNPAGQEAGRRMTGDVVVDAGHPTRTDADGRIELPLIAPGRWRIEARTEDGRAAEATVEVTAGATAEVTLTLE